MQAAEQAAKEAQTTAAAEAEALGHRLEQQSNQFRALQVRILLLLVFALLDHHLKQTIIEAKLASSLQ